MYADEGQPQFSPDGRWVAYASKESGKFEVYVRPVPIRPRPMESNCQWRHRALERRRERTLLHRTGIAASFAGVHGRHCKTRPYDSLEIGSQQKLFETRTVGIAPRYSQFRYRVEADGRFLANTRAETAEPSINLITNWQKLPAAKE